MHILASFFGYLLTYCLLVLLLGHSANPYFPLFIGKCMLSHLSRVQLFVTPWTVAHLVPLSMGFFREEYWRGLPCPTPRDLSDPGIEPVSLMSPVLDGGFLTTIAICRKV